MDTSTPSATACDLMQPLPVGLTREPAALTRHDRRGETSHRRSRADTVATVRTDMMGSDQEEMFAWVTDPETSPTSEERHGSARRTESARGTVRHRPSGDPGSTPGRGAVPGRRIAVGPSSSGMRPGPPGSFSWRRGSPSRRHPATCAATGSPGHILDNRAGVSW
jgi:hypothetical protein